MGINRAILFTFAVAATHFAKAASVPVLSDTEVDSLLRTYSDMDFTKYNIGQVSTTRKLAMANDNDPQAMVDAISRQSKFLTEQYVDEYLSRANDPAMELMFIQDGNAGALGFKNPEPDGDGYTIDYSIELTPEATQALLSLDTHTSEHSIRVPADTVQKLYADHKPGIVELHAKRFLQAMKEYFSDVVNHIKNGLSDMEIFNIHTQQVYEDIESFGKEIGTVLGEAVGDALGKSISGLFSMEAEDSNREQHQNVTKPRF